MWVPLVENNEYDSPGADYFVNKRIGNLMATDPEIDSIILACTHYPLLLNKILKYVPRGVKVIPQGEFVANSLQEYLQRHPQLDNLCTKNGKTRYFTTESPERFKDSAQLFLHEEIEVEKITL